MDDRRNFSVALVPEMIGTFSVFMPVLPEGKGRANV